MANQENKSAKPETKMPPAPTGNASNPSPQSGIPDNKNQLIDKKGEKYLRESGNIEDMPDAIDEQEAENDQSKD